MDLEQSLDTLKIVERLLGITDKVYINSNIFSHADYEEENLDLNDDLYILQGSIEHPIRLRDIIKIYEKMQKQFDVVEDMGRSYFYEGSTFKNNELSISWGS